MSLKGPQICPLLAHLSVLDGEYGFHLFGRPSVSVQALKEKENSLYI